MDLDDAALVLLIWYFTFTETIKLIRDGKNNTGSECNSVM